MPNKKACAAEEKTFDEDMAHNKDLVSRDKDAYSRPLAKLEKAIEEVPENMRAFSMCLRQLYVEYAVGTNEDAAVKFREIRDETRNDAKVYMSGVIPLCKKLISIIDEFLDYYIQLEPDLLRMSFSSINESVQYGTELCKTINHLHQDIMITLEQRENETRNVMMELKDLQKTLKRHKDSLEKKADKKRHGAWSYVLSKDSQKAAKKFAKSDLAMAKAVAHGAQAETQENAANAVTQTLIPALKSFIICLEKITDFFKVLKQNNIEYFHVDKNKAESIKHHCQRFFRCLPSVETNLQAIPTKATNQNYIDRWLEKQIRTIKQNCTPKYAQHIISLIGREIEPEPLQTTPVQSVKNDPPQSA